LIQERAQQEAKLAEEHSSYQIKLSAERAQFEAQLLAIRDENTKLAVSLAASQSAYTDAHNLALARQLALDRSQKNEQRLQGIVDQVIRGVQDLNATKREQPLEPEEKEDEFAVQPMSPTIVTDAAASGALMDLSSDSSTRTSPTTGGLKRKLTTSSSEVEGEVVALNESSAC
jgi:hypothetical protein